MPAFCMRLPSALLYLPKISVSVSPKTKVTRTLLSPDMTVMDALSAPLSGKVTSMAYLPPPSGSTKVSAPCASPTVTSSALSA